MLRIACGLLMLLCAVPVRAGVSAQISDYVDTLDRRLALQDLPSVQVRTARYHELCRDEETAAGRLRSLLDAGDDLSGIALRRLAHELGARRIVFRPALRSESTARSQSLARALSGRPAGPASIESVERFGPGTEGIVAAEGAVARSAPRHGAAVTAILEPMARVPVSCRAGEWYEVQTPTGERAMVHGSGLEVTLDEGTGDGQAGVPPGSVRITDQRPTYYLTTREEGFPVSGPLYGHTYDGTERRTILSPQGTVIATTSGRYFASLCMEGSGILKDGRGVSYASSRRFTVLPPGCKGMTCTGNWVVGFHTLAVNPREMSYGEVYYIPRLAGLTMPDGTVHDGFWFAHDTGSAFQGTPKHRIDMYVDRQEWVAWMEANVNPSFRPLALYRVDRATQRRILEQYRTQLGH